MNKWLAVVGVLAVIAGVVFLGIWFKRMGIRQQEIALSNRYDAQLNVVETSLFKMRSSIKNIHTCTDEWADKFIAVVKAQASGRSGLSGKTTAEGAAPVVAGAMAAGGGTGFTFARESEALGIPSDLYMKLANAIEGQLGNFTRQQEILTDIWREHKTFCEDPVNNEFWQVSLKDKVKPKPEMITSGETKTAVETKKIDEKLF